MEQVNVGGEVLWKWHVPALVLDPDFNFPTRMELADLESLIVMKKRLLPLAEVVTPNLEEAALLTGKDIKDVSCMKLTARLLAEIGANAAIGTRGHLEKFVDVFFDGKEIKYFMGDRAKLPNIYGTGCAFFAALAANLVLGHRLRDAVMLEEST